MDEVFGRVFDIVTVLFCFNSSQLAQKCFHTVLYRQMFQRSPFITFNELEIDRPNVNGVCRCLSDSRRTLAIMCKTLRNYRTWIKNSKKRLQFAVFIFPVSMVSTFEHRYVRPL